MINLDLTGAEVLHPDGLSQTSLSFAEGKVVADTVGRGVDLKGYMVLPGIVDLHGDAFERHVAPRRGAMKQMAEGLIAAEAEIAANGITTALMAQFVSWEGGMRSPEFGDQVFSTIRDTGKNLVTDIQGQLRFETFMHDHYADLPRQITDWGLRYVVFNDHLPHDRLAKGERPKRLVSQALKAGRNPEKQLAMMQQMYERRGEVSGALDGLCATLKAAGVRMGSHDDNTPEARALWRARGVTIAEFPETLEAAEAAFGAGDHVIMGAPNVVRGGSHNGNLSAVDLIFMGQCHALASDYHYPSPRRAALMLAAAGLGLEGAWPLISQGPAKVLGLDDRGTLAPGKRADFVVLEAESKRVAATFAGGRVSYMAGDIAERFMKAL